MGRVQDVGGFTDSGPKRWNAPLYDSSIVLSRISTMRIAPRFASSGLRIRLLFEGGGVVCKDS